MDLTRDDVEIIRNNQLQKMPFPINRKKEDQFSEDIRYTVLVSYFQNSNYFHKKHIKEICVFFQADMERHYGEYGVILTEAVVSTLTLWNVIPENQNENGDVTFLQFLLVAIFGSAVLASDDELEPIKMEFVQNSHKTV